MERDTDGITHKRKAKMFLEFINVKFFTFSLKKLCFKFYIILIYIQIKLNYLVSNILFSQ